jgi:hypothetical protein
VCAWGFEEVKNKKKLKNSQKENDTVVWIEMDVFEWKNWKIMKKIGFFFSGCKCYFGPLSIYLVSFWSQNLGW